MHGPWIATVQWRAELRSLSAPPPPPTATANTKMLHDIPPEVTSEIFVFCLPARASDRVYPWEAPMLLCAVSSSWRKIAIGEGRLWDTLILPDYGAHPSGADVWLRRQIQFLEGGGPERWFNRAGSTRSLSFGMEPQFSKLAAGIAPFTGLLPLVERVVHAIGRHRFRALSIDLSGYSPFDRPCFPSDCVTGDTFTELTSISFAFTTTFFGPLACDADPTDPTRWHTAFAFAPKLRRVKFEYVAHTDPFLKMTIEPWASTLTHLEVDANIRGERSAWIPSNPWMSIFEMCRNLTEAKLSTPRSAPASSPSATSHEHPIKSLTLYMDNGMGQDKWAGLTGPVAFPSLRHLHLEFNSFFGQNHGSSLFRTLVGLVFSDQLLTLKLSKRLNACWLTPNFFVPRDAWEFVEELTANPHAFPKLTHLTFPCTLPDMAGVVPSLMRAMAERDRTRSETLIVTVQVKSQEECDHDESLVSFVEAGRLRWELIQ